MTHCQKAISQLAHRISSVTFDSVQVPVWLSGCGRLSCSAAPCSATALRKTLRA